MSFAVFIGLSCLFVGLLYFYMFKIKGNDGDAEDDHSDDEPEIVNRMH